MSFSFVIFQFLVMAFSLLPREIPLAFAAKLVMVVLNSLSFCLSVKLFISLSNLNESLAGPPTRERGIRNDQGCYG